MSEHENLEEDLIAHLRSEFGDTSIEIDVDTHLAESGVLDSLAFVDFIAYLESTYDVAFDDADYSMENLATVSGCAEFIRKKSLQA